MTESSTSIRIKRLLYRSWHRGCKETDLLLGEFARDKIMTLDAEELDLFEQLLEEQDWDIYAWLTGKVNVPKQYAHPLFEKIKQFHIEKHK